MNWFAERSRRNVVLLSSSLAIGMGGLSMNLVCAPLAGYVLAPDPSLSTLPLAIMFAGMMATTMPASLLMHRIGRRLGFLVGTALGVLGALLAMLAIFQSSFILLCLGTTLLGSANAFSQYYRFAATDTATPDFRPTAISLVMAGGVVAAVIGPNYAILSKDWLAPHTFAGAYLAMISLFLLGALAIAFIDIPTPTAAERKDTGRPLKEIVLQPKFAGAALCSTLGYAIMNLVMTSSPLAIVGCGYGFDDAAFVIQWHAIGMFAPSFVTGHLIKRLGVQAVMALGVGLYFVVVALNVAGEHLLFNFLPSLLLLGVGWNFLFIGATTLLTETYRPEERAKAQGANDFFQFTVVALASLSSGALYSNFGWMAVNLGVLAPVAVIVALLAWMHLRRPAQVIA
jgi:MFS family permease